MPPPSSVTEESVLDESVRLRAPIFTTDDSLAEKLEGLEDHILRGAHMRGALAEMRLDAHRRLLAAREEWDNLNGYEVGAGRLRTQPDHERAKKAMRPDLAAHIEAAEWIISRCTEEMDRHNRDYESCSRTYTILTGS